MRNLRNFMLRLSMHYIVLYILLALRGVSRDQQLFGVWVVAVVYSILTVTVRRVLLIVSLPLIIMTGGLFIFFVDGIVLLLTAALTGLNIANFWWALLGVVVMSNANIWIERAFQAIGWLPNADHQGQENILTRRSPPWWLRLILLAILVFGIIFNAAMAYQLFLLTSKFTRRVTSMMIVADIGFALLTWGIAWLVAEGLAMSRRARFSLAVTLAATVLVAIPTSALILLSDPVIEDAQPAPRPETAYWDLPTGSRIAYSHFPATDGDERNPIVYLHGGPGWAVLDGDIAFFRQFNEAGFDIYFYDQAGCGLSGRLPSIANYTIHRHVEDLEAIRETIQADRLILIGHEAGAEIAARYMVAHPDRVEAVVFYSPSPLWDDEQYVRETIRTAALPVELSPSLEIRPLAALAIARHSPQTAETYVPQDEMIGWANQLVDRRTMVCAGSEALAPQPELPGYNPYVEVMGQVTASQPPDPRPALRRLFIPTILLRGVCDPIDPDVVRQYQEAVPYLKVYQIEDAGSMIHLSRPDVVKSIIVGFLTGEAPLQF